MSDKKETFGGELGKNLPIKEIYNDVAHPALSTIGQTLQGATRVALAPISAMIWGYDKIAGYLDVAIPEYFAGKYQISRSEYCGSGYRGYEIHFPQTRIDRNVY